MVCTHPTLHRVKGTREYILTGCGMCRTCRENFARMWGIRVYHESLLHENSCFVTLTYDDEHLPIGSKGIPTLEKPEISGFMKRLREFIYPLKVRYFGSGEYGDKGHRPHYHVAIYGLDEHNPVVFKDWQKQDDGYFVECRAWNKGLVHVGKLEAGSAFYVAGYALKKVMGKNAKNYYAEKGFIPPFSLMSRRPGIASDWVDKYSGSLLQHGNVVINGKEVAMPRYYADKTGFKDSELYQQMLADRVDLLVDVVEKNFVDVDTTKAFILGRQNAKRQQQWMDQFYDRIKRGKL